MNSESSEPSTSPPPLPRPRSFFVSAVGALMILIGAVGSLMSIFAILNFLVGGYGSRTFEWTGFFVVILGPFILIGAGIGMLMRRRLARYALLVVLAAVILSSFVEMMKPPRPEHTFISPSGVKTTVMASEKNPLMLPIILFSACLGAVFLTRRVKAEFR